MLTNAANLPSQTWSRGGDALSSTVDLDRIMARAGSGKEMTREEMEEVGQQFEGLLLQQLLKTMRATIPESGLFSEESGRRIYENMFDQHVAQIVSEQDSTGLGAMVVAELERQQQASPRPGTGPAPFYPLETTAPLRSLATKVVTGPPPVNEPVSGPPGERSNPMLPLQKRLI